MLGKARRVFLASDCVVERRPLAPSTAVGCVRGEYIAPGPINKAAARGQAPSMSSFPEQA